MKEYLQIYDENNNSLNEKKERKLVHELGLWHREVQIWIINDKNEILIQKRSPNKIMGANKWSLTGGHVSADETLIEAAIRETQEELGLENISAADLNLFTFEKLEYEKGNIKNNHYKYCYILKTNEPEENFKIQKEELSEVKYIALEKLKNLSTEELKEFTSYFSSELFKEVVCKLEKKLKDLEDE